MENQNKINNSSNNFNQNNEKISKKVRWNAISVYLLWIISLLFFFNKSNKYINNDFVKWHIKSSTIIYVWFISIYTIFIKNNLFSNISFFWLGMNIIITNIIFIWLLTLIAIWIYKSYNWKEFKISKKINISKQKIILDIDQNWKITEKEKLTIFISFIPYIWFLNFAKYKDNDTIKNSTRFNIVITLIISLLYIYWYINLANIFSLFYIILIMFIWINLFSRDELIQIKLPKLLSPINIYLLLISFKNYFYNYFNKNEFKKLTIIINEKSEKRNKQDIYFEKKLKEQKDIKLPKFLIYIPIINLIYLFYRKSRYNFHIINWNIITLLFIILSIIIKLWYINSSSYILFIFIMFFWISYLNNNILSYRMPFIFDIYVLVNNIYNFFKSKLLSINKKRSEVKEVNLKVKNNSVKENK